MIYNPDKTCDNCFHKDKMKHLMPCYDCNINCGMADNWQWSREVREIMSNKKFSEMSGIDFNSEFIKLQALCNFSPTYKIMIEDEIKFQEATHYFRDEPNYLQEVKDLAMTTGHSMVEAAHRINKKYMGK